MITFADCKTIYKYQKQNVHRLVNKKPPFVQNDKSIVSKFSANTCYQHKLNALVDYFWSAHQHYVTKSQTLAYYPGYQSIYGHKNDGLEGISRLLPLWAAYIVSPIGHNEQKHAMRQHVKAAFINGTNPALDCYWGNIEHKSTLICEGADIALALWLLKHELDSLFSSQERAQIFGWLSQVIGKETADNNWHLFVVLIDIVLADLDEQHKFTSDIRYQTVKSFYIGNGCFRDGANGEVDLYNAWAFYYCLFWIQKIAPDYDNEFILRATQEFAEWYQYLFTRHGLPLFGRSLCYKMATPVPILMAAEFNDKHIAPSSAIHIMMQTWQAHIKNNGLIKGRPSQGVFGDDEAWLDPYSGPASGFWATRSLVCYLYLSQQERWRESESTELPAQKKIKIALDNANLLVETFPEGESSSITYTKYHKQCTDVELKHSSLKDKIKQLIYAVAHRPGNNLLKMQVSRYTSTLDEYR